MSGYFRQMHLFAALSLYALNAIAVAQSPVPAGWPQTKAERTDYRQTSSYDEVIEFLHGLMDKNPPIRLTWIGRSHLGKPMPLAVVAKNPRITPLQAKAEGKLVVYVQANIHAGEVEGKEASLMLLREIALNPKHPYLDRMVLLFNPIYNIDGNDRWGPGSRNRPSQDGPDPVGVRPNGQGYDLNRDCMKADSPEMRAILSEVYGRWDPEAVMDLHTTNGTRHGFVLTYSPPLNPSMDPGVRQYARDQLLPKVRTEFRRTAKRELFDYGNTAGRGDQMRWETFGQEPRYVTNYAGIRNRVGVLSEAASFQPFSLRVDSTLRFVKLVLDQLNRDANRVVQLCRQADARLTEWASRIGEPELLGIRFEMESRGRERIPIEKPNPDDPVARGRAPKYFETLTMPVFDRFKPSRTTPFPAAYVFAPEYRAAAELAARHGATVERLTKNWMAGGTFFKLSEVAVANQAFQGRRLIRLEGNPHNAKAMFPAGSFLVRTGQPTGMVAFHLLEPESLDGAIAWGFFGDAFKVGDDAPVAKVFGPIFAATEVFSPASWR